MMHDVYQYEVEQLLHLLVAYFPQTAHCFLEGIVANVVVDEHSLSSAKGTSLCFTNKEMYSCFSQNPIAWFSSPACFTAALSSFTDINRNGAALSMTGNVDDEEEDDDDDEGGRTEEEGADGGDIANSAVDSSITVVSSSSSTSGCLGMHTSL